jgi:hypothetical protein
MKKPSTIMSMFEAARNDPAFMERGWLTSFADTGNPYYAWMAIENCIKHKKEFPDLVISYLEQCVERMKSDKAKESADLRKVLPWIFGFPHVLDPTQGKRGPGNLLDPDREQVPDRMLFALRFATRLEKGEDPPTAICNAYNDTFDEQAADADEKTLRRWLLKEFDLKKWPSNTEEWKKICREHYYSFFALLEGTKSRETPP